MGAEGYRQSVALRCHHHPSLATPCLQSTVEVRYLVLVCPSSVLSFLSHYLPPFERSHLIEQPPRPLNLPCETISPPPEELSATREEEKKRKRHFASLNCRRPPLEEAATSRGPTCNTAPTSKIRSCCCCCRC